MVIIIVSFFYSLFKVTIKWIKLYIEERYAWLDVWFVRIFSYNFDTNFMDST